MKKKDLIYLLLGYLRGCRYITLYGILCFLIFAVVFTLYGVPAEFFLYPTALCIFTGIILFIYRLSRFYRKHLALLDMKRQLEIPELSLPEGDSLIERDYNELVQALHRARKADHTEFSLKQKEMMDYYAAWAHQIKAPIAVMSVILQKEDKPEYKELLSELFRIEQYVEMVLCYIRIGDGAADLVIQEYPLDEIIRKAVRKYAAQFVRKRIKLKYDGTCEKVITDEKWLLFILEQILSNAIKYTEKGIITISVSEDKVITISDTGMGIAPEDLPRIFEKGFTGYNGRIDKKSTGIGLYLCKTAADMIGCRLQAASEPGVGSSFTIELKNERPFCHPERP